MFSYWLLFVKDRRHRTRCGWEDPALSLATTGEFVAYPSDGLVPGKNTIALCGGDNTGGSGSITVGPNTLAVRITN
jgi:hypothetical protein